MTFEVYRRLTLRGKKWFWRLRARNGEIVAHGESYSRRIDALNAVRVVRETDEKSLIKVLDDQD